MAIILCTDTWIFPGEREAIASDHVGVSGFGGSGLAEGGEKRGRCELKEGAHGLSGKVFECRHVVLALLSRRRRVCKAARRPVFWLPDQPSLQAFPVLVARRPDRSVCPATLSCFRVGSEPVAWVCSSSPVTATGSRRICTDFPRLLRTTCPSKPSMLSVSGLHRIPTSYM